jgi:uncharacterized protein (DUF433 family)
MALPAVEAIPLREDADQVLRVGATRVTLETVIEAFEAGATPEEITQDYSALELADVYAILTYYLRRRGEVQAYMTRRRAAAVEVRREIEAEPSNVALRERLLARRGR